MSESTNMHGGNIYEAAREFNTASGDILDYSANINPLGIPSGVKKLIASSIESLSNYPDTDCMELRKGIARYLNIPEESIVVGNGASEIIQLIFDVLRLKKILIPAPTFSEYARAAKSAGTLVEYFEIRKEDDFKLNIDHLLSNVRDDVEGVVLCNPNNPTSQLIEKHGLLRLIEHMHKIDKLLIVDEAFIELTHGRNSNSVVESIKVFDNVFVIRAFTKVFAVPGIRLGYGIGKSSIVSEMWERKNPWSVNTFACQMGEVFETEKDYLKRTSLWLENEIIWLYNEMCKFKQFKVYKPSTNFILVEIIGGSLNAALLKRLLLDMGILIRDAGNFQFLNEKFFRIAVKDRKSNSAFLEKLREVLAMPDI